MRGLAVSLTIFAVWGAADAALAGNVIRLAQTSTTTNCMMTCNSQAALCQTTCFVPPSQPVGSTVTNTITPAPGPNPTASTSCAINCANTQITCQTNCARNSPSP